VFYRYTDMNSSKLEMLFEDVLTYSYTVKKLLVLKIEKFNYDTASKYIDKDQMSYIKK